MKYEGWKYLSSICAVSGGLLLLGGFIAYIFPEIHPVWGFRWTEFPYRNFTVPLFIVGGVFLVIGIATYAFKKRSKKWAISFGSLMIALYSCFGLFLLLVGHGFYCETMIELELPVDYHFTLEDSIRWWFLGFFGFIPIYVITSSAEHDGKIVKALTKVMMALTGRKEEWFEEAKPLATSISNAIIVFLTYVVMITVIPSQISASATTFTFFLGGIVGVSTFWHVCTPPWDILSREATCAHTDVEFKMEALKLEHDWIWKAIHIISWVTVILAVSTVFASWAQVIVPAIPVERRHSLTFVRLQASAVVQLIYCVLGLWFGILGRLMENSWRIRKEIAKLGKKS